MKKRADWKFKMVFSTVFGVGVIVLLLAVVTYMNFIKKSVDYNEKIVQLTFQTGEENLMNMMGEAEKYLNRLVNEQNIYEFYVDDFKDAKERTANTRAVVKTFNAIRELNQNIYGVAIVSGEGRTLVSTERGTAQGQSVLSENLKDLMKKSRENYPYVEWLYFENAVIEENQPLYKIVKKPVLLGLRALGEGESDEEDMYLLAAIDEESIAKCYEAAAIYEEGNTLLLDENNRILSSADKNEIGEYFKEEQGIQNISYKLRYHDWMLVSQIPAKVYFGDAMSILRFGLILTVAALCGGVVFLAWWLHRYTNPISILMERMKLVAEEQLDFPKPEPAGLAELDALNLQFYDTVQKLKQYIEKIKKVEDEKKKEELKALQYQINPHFLANSLNSIRWMAILADQNKVADSLAVLSRVFIPMLRNPSFTWKLKDELAFIENYVEMMKIRYGDIIEYHLKCGENLQHEEFPRFILQPVIENCFTHRSEAQGISHIYLDIQKKEEHFTVKIRNTGGFIEPDKLQEINRKIAGEEIEEEETGRKSIGLRNVQKRLYYLYGEYGKITITSDKETGVLVKITF